MKGRAKAGRRRGRSRRRLRRTWIRSLLGVGIALAVSLAALWIYLDVELSERFEGRLWAVPSRVESAPLVVRRGTPLRPELLARRLERSGYRGVDGPPVRPGEFRAGARSVDVFVRSAEQGEDGRRVIVAFDDERAVDLRDPAGSWVERVVFEPERLALFFGSRHEDRRPVPLTEVPPVLVRAVLAAEDARFYEHHGIDLRAVLRAAFTNVREGRIVQGGSTITQQTIKNLYLGQERTWWRKVREAAMALLLDLKYPKDRILEVYLNEVYLGQSGPVAICGMESAARFFFGRGLGELSTGELAFLAGLIRNPGGYNPFVHPDRARERRDRILDAMEERGMLGPDEAARARREPLDPVPGGGPAVRAPYAVDLVRAELPDAYSADVLSAEGLTIRTSLDTVLQDAAEQALGAGLARLERERAGLRRRKGHRVEGALVVLDPVRGAVLALVGGRDYQQSQFNRAVQARRQPGSCFKPFVYLTGFEAGVLGERGWLTPASPLEDEPLEIVSGGKTWRPANYDGLFRGTVTARTALEESLNVPTVRAAEQVGLDELVRVAARCGLPGMRPLPSLALGAQEVSPLELAGAYAVLAAGGVRNPTHVVAEVVSEDGTVLERHRSAGEQAVSPQAAYLVTDVLRGVLIRGTAAAAWDLGFRGDAAGKTGTTDDTRDAWFVGYTPSLLVLVWVGFDDNAPTGLTGSSGALPIWVDFLRRAGRADDVEPFPVPPGIVEVTIDPESGGRAVSACPRAIVESFAEATEPEEACPLHDRPGPLRWLRRLFGRRRDRH